MIAVDSAVWINHLIDRPTPNVLRLRALVREQPLLVGDIVLMEVLQGVRNDREAVRVERLLRQFDVQPMLDPQIAVRAAANYRLLRGKGITVRRSIDLIIGTFCIERGHSLLHEDRDFEPMTQHLGLQSAGGRQALH
jgi:predicted nucleic acid-binding protein